MKDTRARPTDAQYLIFIIELETNANFFEQHTACGSNSLWEPIVTNMNNEEGPTRNIEQWRKILKRWKFTIRRKFRSVDYNKPGALDIFTPVQQRLLLALGSLDVNTCRGCFQKNPSITNKWYPLFKDMDNLSSPTDKAKIYSKITHFQISKFDMLPRWLCVECWKKCEDWYEFLKQCKGCEIVCDDDDDDDDEHQDYDNYNDNNVGNDHDDDDDDEDDDENDDSDSKFNSVTLEKNYKHLDVIKNEKPNIELWSTTTTKPNTNVSTVETNKKDTDGDISIKQEPVNFLSTSSSILNNCLDNLNITFDPLESIFIKEESPIPIETSESIKIELPIQDVVAKSYENITNNYVSKGIISTKLEETIDKDVKSEEDLMVDYSDFGYDQNNDSDDSEKIDEKVVEITDEKIQNKITKYCKIILTPVKIETTIDSKKSKYKPKMLLPKIIGKREFECYDCKKNFIKLIRLKLHLKSHGPMDSNRKHICQICESSFNMAHKLRRHLKRHDPNSQCKCLDCGKVFCMPTDLAAHEKRYMGKEGHPYPHEKPHKCDLCPKAFQQLSDLNFHQEVHKIVIAPPPVHFCEICSKIYKSRKSLRDHFYTCHTKVEKKYLCSECGKRFIKPNHLATHQRTHDPTAELLACTKCNKKFNTPPLLRAHLKTHSDHRPYVCSIEGCNKSFKTSNHLRTHNRVHTGARPFPCDICNMTFAYSDVLKRHKKKHADMEY